MADPHGEQTLAKILERFDGASSEALLRSLASEFVSLHRAHAALEARLAVMETLLGAADRILDAATGFAPAYPTRVQIDADDAMLDIVGFHQMEYDSKGAPYRWTGPERHFSFQIFVDRRAPGAFTLKFGEVYAQLPAERMRAFVDGKETPITLRKLLPTGWEVKGVLPQRREAGGTVLTFVAPQVLSPQSKGLKDIRLLGVSFRSLSVEVSRPAAAAVLAKLEPALSETTVAPAAKPAEAPPPPIKSPVAPVAATPEIVAPPPDEPVAKNPVAKSPVAKSPAAKPEDAAAEEIPAPLAALAGLGARE